jgi:hypothetical protein
MSPLRCFAATVALLLLYSSCIAQVQQTGVWTQPDDDTIPDSFTVQGEYEGTLGMDKKLGAQVIALDEAGALQAVLYPGGLPGAGWDGKRKVLLSGTLADGKVDFQPADGDRKYMDGNPEKFSATQSFPPTGQADWTATIHEGVFAGKTDSGGSFELKKRNRASPTLSAKAPAGAIILFDGTNLDHWNGGRLDKKTHVLHTDAKDLRSKSRFKYYTVHLEFRTPFRPTARGQKRGNSGFYQSNGQEIQVLDSFGLDGLKNECGALYGRAAPSVNMCLPPLTWQTYDVELIPNPDNKNSALLTVRHNGVVIHDKVPSRVGNGTFKLQGHGNLLQYRTIWLVDHSEQGSE